jgi:RecQ-mediated genome instability protein 1
VIARGMVLLEPDKCIMLGGKIEAWQKAWVDGRLTRLKEEIQQNERQRS